MMTEKTEYSSIASRNMDRDSGEMSATNNNTETRTKKNYHTTLIESNNSAAFDPTRQPETRLQTSCNSHQLPQALNSIHHVFPNQISSLILIYLNLKFMLQNK